MRAFMNALEKVLRFILIVLISVMTIFVFVQVIARYVVGEAIGWGEEFTRYLFIYSIFLGGAVCVRKNMHVGVDLLTEKLRGKAKIAVAVLVELLVIVFLGVVMWYGSVLAMRTMGQRSPALGIPIGTVYAAIPLGAALAILFSIEKLAGLKRGGERP
jgi:TRAP-type C4-dicarboxylate transport system permease small subunit